MTALETGVPQRREMAALVQSKDWTQTSLGPPEGWPQSLRSALSICIGSAFPIAIYWGPDLALVYNDAWSPILGQKHPWALGRGAREVWPEIWETIGPLFEQVISTGAATYEEDGFLPMHRHGYTEECYFNFTFTPIRGESGRVEGVFNAVVETTYRVVSERRTRVLPRARRATSRAPRSLEETCSLAAREPGARGLRRAVLRDLPHRARGLSCAARGDRRHRGRRGCRSVVRLADDG